MRKLIPLVGVLFLMCGKGTPPKMPPFELQGYPEGEESVSLVWGTPSGEAFVRYLVERSFSESNRWFLIDVKSSLTDTQFTDTTVSPYLSYRYRVIAERKMFISDTSNTVQIDMPPSTQYMLWLSPRYRYAVMGDTVDLGVRLENVEDLFGCSFQLLYDTSAVAILSIAPGDFFDTSGIFFSHHEFGILSVALSLKRGAEPLFGSGLLFELTLLTKKRGRTYLDFVDTSVVLQDSSGREIDLPSLRRGCLIVK